MNAYSWLLAGLPDLWYFPNKKIVQRSRIKRFWKYCFNQNDKCDLRQGCQFFDIFFFLKENFSLIRWNTVINILQTTQHPTFKNSHKFWNSENINLQSCQNLNVVINSSGRFKKKSGLIIKQHCSKPGSEKHSAWLPDL